MVHPSSARSLAFAAALVLSCAPVPVDAGDVFNPFGEPETSRPPPKKTAPVAETPTRPVLAPMEGRLPPPSTGGLPQSAIWPEYRAGSPEGAAPPAAAGGPSYGEPYTPSGAETPMGASPASPGRQAIRSEPLTAPPAATPPAATRPSREGAPAPIRSSEPALPYEMWQGLTVADFETRLAKLEIPPRSPAVHRLWRRLITADVGAPGAAGDARFAAVRAEALSRSGLIDDAADVLAREPTVSSDPVLQALSFRTAVERGRREACESGKALAASAALPATLKGQMALLSGYCAAVRGNLEAAALGAGLLREMNVAGDPYSADALESLTGGPLVPRKDKPFTLIDWRIVSLKEAPDAAPWVPLASPALLGVLALDPAASSTVRLEAAEAAARLNIVSADQLAAIYRAAAPPADLTGADLGSAEAISGDAAARRAALFKAAEAERTPQRKTRLIRSFLDSARRAGLYWPALQVMSKPALAVIAIPEVGWFTETAIETALASANYAETRRWAAFGETLDRAPGAAGFAHWTALADLADASPATDRSASAAAIETLVASGRLDSDTVHRLATVLDALDGNVPMPLWSAASKVPEPKGGHLPETGLLAELSDASAKKEFGRTVLLSMQALGPDGAEGAHILALGDCIRALKRAGLETDARALALEAVFASWPRAIVN